MEQAIDVIYNQDHEKNLMDIILGLSKPSVEDSGEDGLDLMHHCIFASNSAVAKWLLMRGYFQPTGQEQKLPYIHLACLIGRPQLVITILEYRTKEDFKITVEGSGWKNLDVIEKWMKRAEQLSQAWKKLTRIDNTFPSNCENVVFMPLDVAAIYENLNCVKTLLHFGNSRNNVIESAVEFGSHHALALLLSSEPYNQDHINIAFKTALRRKLPKCLDILLKKQVNASHILNGLNPFHVLYMYSSAYQAHGPQNRNKGLDECTSVLVKHGFDVNEKEPIGSYPLYSAIHAMMTEKDHVPNHVPIYNINSMCILLKHGADPNFDEQQYINEHTGDERHPVALTLGRDPFSSALCSLFVMLQSSDTWVPHISEHMDRCCLGLLEHGADPNYTDSCGETPLHDLVKALAMQHAMGHMNVDFGSMIRMLLYFGGDAGLMSTNGLFAVHYYFVILMNLMGGLIAFTRWKQADNASQVLQLLYFMNIHEAVDACGKIQETLQHPTGSEVEIPQSVVLYIKELMQEFVYKPKGLQTLCKMVIWKAVGRKKAHLKELHIPKALMYKIMDMFTLDLDL